MDESLRVRKAKMLARANTKKLLAQGKLNIQEVCLAATNDGGKPNSKLIYPKFEILEDEYF
jgi:hypothetical protein